MLLKTLREEVLEANLELVRRGLVLYTFGNVSGMDRSQGLVAIKPSGVPYEALTPEKIVVSDMAGKILAGEPRPSSDFPPHFGLSKTFPWIAGPAPNPSQFSPALEPPAQPHSSVPTPQLASLPLA